MWRFACSICNFFPKKLSLPFLISLIASCLSFSLKSNENKLLIWKTCKKIINHASKKDVWTNWKMCFSFGTHVRPVYLNITVIPAADVYLALEVSPCSNNLSISPMCTLAACQSANLTNSVCPAVADKLAQLIRDTKDGRVDAREQTGSVSAAEFQSDVSDQDHDQSARAAPPSKQPPRFL